MTLCLAWFASDGSGGSLLLLGHPTPLLLAGGRVEQVAVRPALPLGLANAVDCSATHLALPTEWSLLLHTDGLVEGFVGDGSGDRYGVERLLARLRRETHHGLDEPALDNVLSDVKAANGGPLPDDVAVLCVSRSTRGTGNHAEWTPTREAAGQILLPRLRTDGERPEAASPLVVMRARAWAGLARSPSAAAVLLLLWRFGCRSLTARPGMTAVLSGVGA